MSGSDDADNQAEREGTPPIVALPFPTGPDTDPAPDPLGAAPRRRRWTVLRLVATGITLVLIIAVVASAFIRVPYYRFSPGSLYDTESLITVDGGPSYKTDGGQIDFTTVSSKTASVLDALLARFDQSVDLIDAQDVEGNRSPDETRQANLEMMADAKQVAEVVALRKLGYPVQIEGTGALVTAVGKNLPAASVLGANDTIVAIDGKPINLGDEAVAVIGSHKPGDTVTMKVESTPQDPGHDVSVTLASRCLAKKADETCTPDEAAQPLLGVSLATRDTRFQLPVQVNIDTKDVGGPSAGLALTLGVIDVLTPGSLTGGQHIATTGTIDLRGNVGPIGGIKQKTFLAMRSGVSLFLVPTDELAEAQKYAEGSTLKVVGVATMDDALKALQSNGGSTGVVDQVAAANTPGSSLPAS